MFFGRFSTGPFVILVLSCLILQHCCGGAQEGSASAPTDSDSIITGPNKEMNYIRPDLIEIYGPTLDATEMIIIHGISRAILDEILVYRYDDQFPDNRVQARIIIEEELHNAQIVYWLFLHLKKQQH